MPLPGVLATVASGINGQGEIVGIYRDSLGSFHGFLLRRSVFTYIDVPGSNFTEALGINSEGDIVGDFSDSLHVRQVHSFLLNNHSFIGTDVLGGGWTEARGINQGGEIVGDYFDLSDTMHGFVFSGGSFSTIDVPNAASTGVGGIKNQGGHRRNVSR